MLDWDSFRTVLEVARHGTLTRAAAGLGVTRTTVGRHLNHIETTLGVPVFHRTPNGLELTTAGQELVDTARRVETELLASEGRALARDPSLSGKLRVSVMDMVFTGFADVFASFVASHPGVELTVCTSDVYVSLSRREADVAIRLGNAPGDHLVGRRVRRVEFELYASRALAERVGLDRPLSGWPWLGWDTQQDSTVLDNWLATHAPGARVVMRFSSVEVAHRCIRQGIGILFLPTFLGEPDPALVSLGVQLDGQGRDLWLLTLPELTGTPRVRAFLDHVYGAFTTR